MARTWRSPNSKFAELNFEEGKDLGSQKALHYGIRKNGSHIEVSVSRPPKPPLTLPVQAMVGGERHGQSFLLHLDQLGGLSLARPALIEARYALSHAGTLVLSPGFRKETPLDREDELGRVLSPTFELRCLTCHGKPGTLGAGSQGGVRCESCHGEGSTHVESLTVPGSQLIKPKRLEGEAIIEVCAQCHSGLSPTDHSDPMPEDLLVSSQVPALRNSECYIQSGKQLTCTACHDPHTDSTAVAQSSVKVCLRCHSISTPQHAGICPVDQKEGCVGCHMPSVQSDSFRLTDHWIRAHPESSAAAHTRPEAFSSQVIPKREFLRLIAVESDEQMNIVRTRLGKGEPFSAVAHDLSVDPTAPGGGFIGDVALADMNPQLSAAASHLVHDANSDVIHVGDKQIMLHRMSRDFKWQADLLFKQAEELNNRGDRLAAITKNQRALEVYPYMLRSLVLMGTMLGQAGDAGRASEVLAFAAQSYPHDATSEFNLALTLSKQPASQIEALRRTIGLDPDMTAAYESLGAVLYATGKPAEAIATFRSGLQIDPLSAILYYDLGLALNAQGDDVGAKDSLNLAVLLDPDISAHKTR